MRALGSQKEFANVIRRLRRMAKQNENGGDADDAETSHQHHDIDANSEQEVEGEDRNVSSRTRNTESPSDYERYRAVQCPNSQGFSDHGSHSFTSRQAGPSFKLNQLKRNYHESDAEICHEMCEQVCPDTAPTTPTSKRRAHGLNHEEQAAADSPASPHDRAGRVHRASMHPSGVRTGSDTAGQDPIRSAAGPTPTGRRSSPQPATESHNHHLPTARGAAPDPSPHGWPPPPPSLADPAAAG